MSAMLENSPKINAIDVFHVDSYFLQFSARTRFLVHIQLYFKLKRPENRFSVTRKGMRTL